MPPVKRDQGTQVDVAEVVSVDDHNVVGIVGQIGVSGNRARRAEQVPLERLHETKPAFGVHSLDVGSDQLGQGVGADPGLCDSGFGQAIDPEVEQGPFGDWDQTSGDCVGEATQPGCQLSCQEEYLNASWGPWHRSIFLSGRGQCMFGRGQSMKRTRSAV